MARIAGVDIPRSKQVWVSLQYIYGIGPVLSQKILAQTSINPDTKVEITRGTADIQLIKFEGHNFFDVLRKKLQWATSHRR